MKRSIVSGVLDFIKDIVVCFLIVYGTLEFVFRPVIVKGNSMYPTLNDRSYGLTNVAARKLGSLNRFDIVIIYIKEKNEYIVKRIVGLPGETIMYRNGQLYVNGEKKDEPFLDQSYIQSCTGTFMSDIEPITLGDDQYYCLGDNRPHSSDSRVYGPFSSEQIISKDVFIILPFSEFGDASK